MAADSKLVQAIGRRLQRYAATPRRAEQLAAELTQMESFMKRQAQRLTFEDEPARFVAARRRPAKTQT